jgi:Protein of unknown function (DUF2877)
MSSHEISAVSIAPTAKAWLTNTHEVRLLHVFDHACNLINERQEVLSIVTPEIGNGPFNLVVEDDILFPEHLHAQSPISIQSNQLNLGDFTLNLNHVSLWSPCPDWGKLHAYRENILNQLISLPIIAKHPFRTNYLKHSGFPLRGLRDMPLDHHSGLLNYQYLPIAQSPISSSLLSSLVNVDIPSSLTATRQLAGLGQGLTPSGDDFMMGAIYAAWIIHPMKIATVLAQEISNTAAPLTTSLSAAWLRSAGKGEAGSLWHEFFDALITGKDIQLPITKLLSVGETSGADALEGFIGVFTYWGEQCSNL